MENRIKLSDDMLENVSGGAQQENITEQSGNNKNTKRMYCEECGKYRDFLLVGGGVALCLAKREHRKNV